MNWVQLTTEEQLVDIDLLSEQSDIKAVLILKHSTRCGISSMALNRLERNWKSSPEVPAYYLDLLNYRELSGNIAVKYGITHQSPQILVIKNRKCIYTASHSDINASDIEAAINS